MNFTTPMYAFLFVNSETYIVHVINCEWSRSVNFSLRMFCMRYKHVFFQQYFGHSLGLGIFLSIFRFWGYLVIFRFMRYFGHFLGFMGILEIFRLKGILVFFFFRGILVNFRFRGYFGHFLGLRGILVIFSDFWAYLMTLGVFWSF